MLDRTAFARISTPASVVVIGVIVWGGMILTSAAAVALVAVAGIASFVIMVQLRSTGWLGPLTAWFSIFLWLSIAAVAVESASEWGISRVDSPSRPVPAINQSDGDIIFAVFDGFPPAHLRLPGLESGTDALFAGLRRRGFWIQNELPASYSRTDIAIPAMTALGLVLEEGDIANPATGSDLAYLAGGGGSLFEILRDGGYEVTIVESGWSSLRCVDDRDICAPRPWLDDGTIGIARASVLRPLVDRTGLYEWRAGIDHTLKWIHEDLGDYSRNRRDDFVFLHVMVPHFPSVYNSDCLPANRGTHPEDFSQHVTCAVEIMERIADRAGTATVLLAGDHGSETRGQMSIAVADWDKAMFLERTRTFGATRGMQQCHEPRPTVNTNVPIWLLRCLGATELPFVEDVSFVTSILPEPLVSFRPENGLSR